MIIDVMKLFFISLIGEEMKKVTLYTLSTCPWCLKTKTYFIQHNIPFEYTDYDLADEATKERIMKELESIGAKGFPFVKIDDVWVEGYQPNRYKELLAQS